MKTKILTFSDVIWKNNNKLEKEIENFIIWKEVIDIKYSCAYDNTFRKVIHSALILYK